MGDTLKLRLKVGIHEFDAEGPAEEVNARFESWKEMIDGLPAPSRQPRTMGVSDALFGRSSFGPLEQPPPAGSPIEEPPKVQNPYAVRVFSVDERRDLLTLRVQPAGETRESDSVLLLIYGYGELRDME